MEGSKNSGNLLEVICHICSKIVKYAPKFSDIESLFSWKGVYRKDIITHPIGYNP